MLRMMKGTLAAISALTTLGMVASVNAAPRELKWTDESLRGAIWEQPVAATVSPIIYMNNCSTGCTITPGSNNAPMNRSSIPNQTSNVPKYTGSAAQWNQLVACVRATYAAYNVQVVTDRPPAGTNYHMAIVAGTPQSVGMQSGVLGVSPFSCGYIANSVSFTFANVIPSNISELCWTVAQETAHSWGLDHKYDNRDPMTYLSGGPAMKTFQNQAGSCGEYSARQCQCTYAGTGASAMNSHALIMSLFGPSMPATPDTMPPAVSITSPAANATVVAGFEVTANITDNVAVAKAELRIDGNLVGTDMAAPWSWSAPASVGQGSHRIEVKAYDAANNSATGTVDVVIGFVCTGDGDCMGSEVCLSGHCVAGPDMPGGLGTPCADNGECTSGQCATSETDNYCVDSCDPAKADSCPSGFGCVLAGNTGVCWPGSGGDGSSGGCNTGGDGGTVLVGLGFAAVLFSRRRRR